MFSTPSLLLPATGIIQVKPPRNLKKHKREFEEEMIVLKVPDELGAYYRWFIEKHFGPAEFTRTLENNPMIIGPNHGAHISLVDRKSPLKCSEQYLQSINKKTIKFKYSPIVYRHWQFFAIPVYSKELDTICREIGYKPVQLHITIGRLSLQALDTQDKLLLRTV